MTASASNGVIIVFARRPEAGHVKTRLTPPLPAEHAAGLYGAMLDDVLEVTGAAARELSLAAEIAVTPADAVPELAARAPAGFRVWPQRGHDLAARMGWAAREALAGGHRSVLLRGSDSPALPPQALKDALDALASADVVLSPDPDGGYNLIGLGRFRPDLFDLAMSSGSELDDTAANAAQAGLRVTRLRPGFDIDTAADLALLAEARTRGACAGCPRTLAYLDEYDLWRFAPTR